MIPKIIHYCWFGRNPKPRFALKCIKSWKRYCPDYQIIEWNEDNFNLDYNAYTRYCYDNGRWAFLSDLARLIVVEQMGGLYFDTDVEVIKAPDAFLKYQAFYGFENSKNIATGLGFGSEAHHPALKSMIHEYDMLQPNDDGSYPLVVCPALNTKALLPFGLKLDGSKQDLDGIQILPIDYLNPYDDQTGRLNKTSNTISIHWYSKTWMSKWSILRSTLTKPFHRIFGVDCFKRFR